MYASAPSRTATFPKLTNDSQAKAYTILFEVSTVLFLSSKLPLNIRKLIQFTIIKQKDKKIIRNLAQAGTRKKNDFTRRHKKEVPFKVNLI